jgi:HD-like signal output (HDOD) protein/CheY-like chemotaxis protein
MKRILFVDDESNVLDGLRRSLRSMRKEWHMEFANGGREALLAVQKQSFDVVVSDMRMPEMDGADLLARIMKECPDAIRLVLSGHADPAAIMKSVGVTHQYLSKPCDTDVLRKAIDRACTLKALIESAPVREIVSKLGALPTIPSVYQELVACLQSERSTAANVAAIIGRDVGMTARILQLVNSAFFGLARSVTTLERAVAYLGLDTIGSLVLAQGVFQQYDGLESAVFDADAFMSTSLRTAAVAKAIAEHEKLDKTSVDQAFLAGMLHNVGELVLAVQLPEQYSQYAKQGGTEGPDSERLGLEIFGTSHAHVGAYLLGLWGLPNPIVEGVAYHDNPNECAETGLGLFGIVHIASRAVRHASIESFTDPSLGIRLDYFSRAGAADRLPAWQTVVRRTLGAQNVEQGAA